MAFNKYREVFGSEFRLREAS